MLSRRRRGHCSNAETVQQCAQEQVHKLGKGDLCAAAESMPWCERTTQYADDDSRSNFATEPARTEPEHRENQAQKIVS
jgi:hypothetical protein